MLTQMVPLIKIGKQFLKSLGTAKINLNLSIRNIQKCKSNLKI